VVAVAGGVVLGIRLRFNNHTPQQLAIRLPFHQQAADKLRRNLLGRAGEEGLGEMLGGRGGYGSGFGEWAAKMKRLDTMVFSYAFLGTKNRRFNRTYRELLCAVTSTESGQCERETYFPFRLAAPSGCLCCPS